MLVSTLIVSCTMVHCYKDRMHRLEREQRGQAKRPDPAQRPVHYPHFSISEDDLRRSHTSNSNYSNPGNYVSITIPSAQGNKGLYILEVDQQQNNDDDEGDNRDIDLEAAVGVRQPTKSGARLDSLLNSSQDSGAHPFNPSHHELSALPHVHHSLSRNNNQGAAGTPRPCSPLPRPLQWQRPVIADTFVTSSKKVVTTIMQPKEPRGKNAKRAHGPVPEAANMIVEQVPRSLAQRLPSPGSSKTSSHRKGSINNNPIMSAYSQTQERLPKSPNSGASVQGSKLQGNNNASEEAYSGKEEVHRKPPQTILPEGYQQPMFTDLVPRISSTTDVSSSSKATAKPEEDSDADPTSSGPSTANLILEPYLPKNDQAQLKVETPSIPSATASVASAFTSFDADSHAPASAPFSAKTSPPPLAATVASPFPSSLRSPPAVTARRERSDRGREQQQELWDQEKPDSSTITTIITKPAKRSQAAFPLPRASSASSLAPAPTTSSSVSPPPRTVSPSPSPSTPGSAGAPAGAFDRGS
ncbi:hypothetical protein BGZ65_010077, partial [Modicella reniformis]